MGWLRTGLLIMWRSNKTYISFPKSGNRVNMMVYRSVGVGCEIGCMAKELFFFIKKTPMLQQWVPPVKKQFWPAFAFAPFGKVQVRNGLGVFLSVEG